MVPLNGHFTRVTGYRGAPLGIRIGHFLRIESYLDWATLSMWSAPQRVQATIGMAEASLRAPGPTASEREDEDLLERLRALIRETEEYHVAGDFEAAMARMRVAHDLVALHIIRLAEG